MALRLMLLVGQILALLGTSLFPSGEAFKHRQLADASPPPANGLPSTHSPLPPPPAPPLPPFPPGPPGSISCYLGATNTNNSDYDTALVLTPGYIYCAAWSVTMPGARGEEMEYNGQSPSDAVTLRSCAQFQRQLMRAYSTNNVTITGFYCCDTDACNDPTRTIAFAPDPPSPPTMPSLPPFPPFPPGTIACYVGNLSDVDDDYSAPAVLTTGFNYCTASALTLPGTGQQVLAYGGQTRDVYNILYTCQQALRDSTRDQVTAGARVVGFYCCDTSACNAPGQPITSTPQPPSPPLHPALPPFPPGSPGTVSCYTGVTGANNTDYNTQDLEPVPDYSYCISVVLSASVFDSDAAQLIAVYGGVTPNVDGTLDSCGHTLRLVTKAYQKALDASIVAFYCCHAQACNSPDNPILDGPPPPPPSKKKPRPPPPCKSKRVKPPPKRKSPSHVIGRRMAD